MLLNAYNMKISATNIEDHCWITGQIVTLTKIATIRPENTEILEKWKLGPIFTNHSLSNEYK